MMACCHALMNVEGELVGDPLEKAAFLASGWQLLGSTGGAECRGPFGGAPCTVRHVQKFHFSSELKRMSVVVRLEGPRGLERMFVLAKGAPEVLQRLFAASPAGYERAHRTYASQGGRVIALAIKELPAMSMSELKAIRREEVRLVHRGLRACMPPPSHHSVPCSSSRSSACMTCGSNQRSTCFCNHTGRAGLHAWAAPPLLFVHVPSCTWHHAVQHTLVFVAVPGSECVHRPRVLQRGQR